MSENSTQQLCRHPLDDAVTTPAVIAWVAG
jgi:hypothetical protein